MTPEEPALFPVGTIVYLKSGSPAMTVELNDIDLLVHVVWFEFQVYREFFPEATLTLERPDGSENTTLVPR